MTKEDVTQNVTRLMLTAFIQRQDNPDAQDKPDANVADLLRKWAETARAGADAYPDDAALNNIAGWSLVETGHPSDAEKYLACAITLAPREDSYLINYTHVLNLLGKHQQAAALLESRMGSLEPPPSSDIVGALGYTYLKTGQFDHARQMLEQATKMSPDNPVHFVNLASAMAPKEQKSALPDIAVDPHLFRYNFTKHRLGKHQDLAALPYIQHAREQVPDKVDRVNYTTTLAQTFNRLNRYGEGLPLFQEAAEIWAPAAMPEVCNGLAEAFAGLGQVDKAIAILEKAQRTDPQESSFPRHLKRLQNQSGR